MRQNRIQNPKAKKKNNKWLKNVSKMRKKLL